MQNCDEQILDKLTNMRKNRKNEYRNKLSLNRKYGNKCPKHVRPKRPKNARAPEMCKKCFQRMPHKCLKTEDVKNLLSEMSQTCPIDQQIENKNAHFLSMGHAWARFERYQKGHFKMYAHEHDLGLISEPKNKYHFQCRHRCKIFEISMTNTRIPELRRTNAGQFDKHTEIPEKLNTGKNGRLN